MQENLVLGFHRDGSGWHFQGAQAVVGAQALRDLAGPIYASV